MTEKKEYWVSCEVRGKATCHVLASNEEEALEKARAGVDLTTDWDIDEWEIDTGFRSNDWSNFDIGVA